MRISLNVSFRNYLCLIVDSVHELKQSGLTRDTQETRQAISVLDSKFSATAKIVSAIPDKIHEIDSAAVDTRVAVEHLAKSISEEMAHLPNSVNRMLEGTLRRVLQDFYDSSSRPPAYSELESQGSVNNNQVSPKPREISTFNGNSCRKVLKQKRGKRAIETWFGTVFVHSTAITTQPVTDKLRVDAYVVATKTTQMSVDVVITPCLLRIGLFCSLIWKRMPKNQSGFDMKLRVYNNVDTSAPIIQACQAANLQEVQSLFAEGKASPYDRLGGKRSLLDIILEQMVLLPMRRDPEFALKKIEDLYGLFKMIVNHGLDPGKIWTNQDKFGGSPLPFWALFSFYTPAEFLPIMLSTTRTIIEHSIQDPFSTADFTEWLRFLQSAASRTPLPVSQLIMNQEYWQAEWEIKEKLTPFHPGQRPEQLGRSDAQCFRTWLEYGVDHSEALMALRESDHQLYNAVRDSGLPGDIADRLRYHHIVVCLEAGVDIQDDCDGPSILTICREGGKLYQVRAALWHLKWNDDDITELFEADLWTSLTFQLAHLEHREVDARKLPTTLEFQSISKQDWNGFLEKFYMGCFLSTRSTEALQQTEDTTFESKSQTLGTRPPPSSWTNRNMLSSFITNICYIVLTIVRILLDSVV